MSGSSYDDNKTYSSPSYTSARSESEKKRLYDDRASRVHEFKSEVASKASTPRPVKEAVQEYNAQLVRNKITHPTKGTKRIYVVLIDNSGSNRQIASHFKKSSNYLRVNLQILDPEAQFVFIYFSDHTDGDAWFQAVDFISANPEGEKILTSTIHEMSDANGYDYPEAHECALKEVCQINFSDVIEKHLILISDVAGHNMGMNCEDRGCPYQQDWRDSLKLVEKTYQTFELIGCGNDEDASEIQKKFINYLHPELLAMNFISLAHIREHQHRLGIVLNSFLLLVARHRGLQGIEGFLSRLYEKWLSDPIFGDNTDRRAKEVILRFSKYIPCSYEEKIEMMTHILVSSSDEVKRLIKQGAISM